MSEKLTRPIRVLADIVERSEHEAATTAKSGGVS